MSILVDFKDTYWVELYSYNNIHSKHPELLFAFTYFTYLFNLNMVDVKGTNKFKFEIDFNGSNVNRHVAGWGNVGSFIEPSDIDIESLKRNLIDGI